MVRWLCRVLLTVNSNLGNLNLFLTNLPCPPPTYLSNSQNTLYGDKSAASPGGVRLGTPAMTTRGLNETDFGETVARFLDRAASLACAAQERAGSKKLAAFVEELERDEGVKELKRDVEAFASRFYFPGVGGGDGGGGGKR